MARPTPAGAMQPLAERQDVHEGGAGRTMVTWNLVTVSYNSATALEKHWSDTNLPRNVRWTVVDNASSDGSAELARSLGAEVIQLRHNVGFGAANNIGAASARSTFTAFVNPDVYVDFESLRVAEEFFSAHPTAILAPQLLHPDGQMQASGRGIPTIWSKVNHRLRGHRGTPYQLFAQPGQRVFVEWAMGAAIILRTDMLTQLRWDPIFFVYYEDHDLGIRAWRAGHQVVLHGDLRWTHSWARETVNLNLAAWRLELASMFKFYRRYPHLLLPRAIARLWHPERHILGAEESSRTLGLSDRSGDG